MYAQRKQQCPSVMSAVLLRDPYCFNNMAVKNDTPFPGEYVTILHSRHSMLGNANCIAHQLR